MEPWENDLRKAFADFEPQVNEDHWKAVMAKRRESRRSILPIFWRVAASVALLLAVVWMIRWDEPSNDLNRSDTALKETEAHGSPISAVPSENRSAKVHGLQEESQGPVSTMVKKRVDIDAGKQVPSPVSEAADRLAITSQGLATPTEEPSVIPARLPIPDRLAQRGNVDRIVARIALPVTQDHIPSPKSTPFWRRIRRLPLFSPSESTLPERTVETWAILQPESLHRFQDMARRPTTIEIIW